MNRRSGSLAVLVALLCLGPSLSAAAQVLGGETWTSALRIRTIATAQEKGKWGLEVHVFDRVTGESILSREAVTYTNRTRDIQATGLDQREYRFSIAINENELETRLEIRELGDPVDYVRSLYSTEPRVQLATRSAAEPQVLRVGGRILAPELVRHVEPVYPQEARDYRVSGVVVIEATIDETGTVRRTRVVKGLPFGLSDAAEAAVQRWKFRPATMEGNPVSVAHNVTVEFNLHRN